jgi:hypothetical protein
MFEGLQDSFLMTELWGGKVSLVATPGSTAIFEASWSPILAVAIGFALLLLAKLVPEVLS